MSTQTEKLYPLDLIVAKAQAHGATLTGTPVKVTDLRYTVPGHYTTGDAYPTLSEAAAAAEASITTFDFNDRDTGLPAKSRAFVDLRATIHYAEGGSSDGVIERIEVFA